MGYRAKMEISEKEMEALIYAANGYLSAEVIDDLLMATEGENIYTISLKIAKKPSRGGPHGRR